MELELRKDFVRYSEGLEQKEENEEKSTQELVDSFKRSNETTCSHYRHAVRGAHAKSHAILKGTLEVLPGVDAAYSQGLFKSPRSYEVIARLSTAPGDLLPDSVSTARGFALKVLGVNGPMLAGHEGQSTQDFLFASGLSFPAPTIAAFLSQQKLLEVSVDYLVRAKEITSLAARAANSALKTVGLDTPKLGLLGHPPIHMLAEEYGTQAPIRYGEYVAKLALRPSSANAKALSKVNHHIHKDFSAIQLELREFFANEAVEFDVCVQLCNDVKKMPIEDATVEWSQKESPYVVVAKLKLPAQDSYSPAKRVYGDDSLSFSPWQGLAEHQPLGRIMRARKPVYEGSSKYRHAQNVCPHVEPKALSEMPE